ncbi:glycosyltransferase family protein [Mucilaginibacter psychrotolerans]|uniref:Glycosyltransferase family 1 protein n=1 Tax=Mucilaginibacter psychrotolerans TaxID=1524096 RepID=A0A4Y8SJW2_9SPHI|nr:hypothetical protein [Mucilaginibacter psychrotolerans]TFF38817.1 hypothetical protein E2R66_07365 [Mucilaginibacter psychrotolerans]
MAKKIKIVFICSSLEPGHDGVGDYSRRLAAALIKAGHNCMVLSLADRHIAEQHVGTQQADGVDVPVMRLSSAIQIKQRFALAKIWVDGFNPEWLSLQFVPFGYHPKGLMTGLSKLLLGLGHGRRWHIMFHELWVGIAEEESQKLKWWGKAQRMLIKSLAANLKPALIHTQTALYQTLLAKIGFEAGYLPLYGNIPVTSEAGQERTPKERLDFVVFGAIHDRAPIAAFAREVALYQQTHQAAVSLTIMGRGNSEQERWANEWKKVGLTLHLYKELLPERISEILSASTIGLSATALAVIEKSGSYAAMREHGLPVISVSKPWTPRSVARPAVPPGVTEYIPGNFEDCISSSIFTPYGTDVTALSIKFAMALDNYKAD